MLLPDNDLSTQFASDQGDTLGAGTLSTGLTGETPPVVYQNLADSGTAAPPAMVPASAIPSSSAPAAPAPAAPVSGPSPFRSALNSLLVPVGKTSNALNEAGQKAATAVGISPDTAAKIGPVVPWLICAVLLGGLVTIWGLRHRIFSPHKVAA